MNITASIVSHDHREEVLMLLGQLNELRETRLRRVVLTLNRPEPSLSAKLARTSFLFELIVLENANPAGFGTNHNRAFACDGNLVPSGAFAVLNPDLRLLGNPLALMADELIRHQRTGAVYPEQLDVHGAPQDHERRLPTPARLVRRYVGGRKHEAGLGAIDWVNAACLMVRREAYEQIFGFDERYHMYCEDVDFCLRLQLEGWNLVKAHGALTQHVGRRASHGDVRHTLWHLASLLRLWRSDAYRSFRQIST